MTRGEEWEVRNQEGETKIYSKTELTNSSTDLFTLETLLRNCDPIF